MADIKLFDVIERAFEKNAINKAKPGSEKLKGLENIYSPKMQEVVPKYGDAAAMAIPLFISTEAQPYAESRRKIEKYLSEGKSDRVINELNDITKMNRELMSQEPTTAIQNKLISNTEREVQLPRDTIEDIEMDLQNNPHLSEKEMEQIKKNALERFAKDQKPLNNLEATRPDRGTLGHSLDTALLYGIMLQKYFPSMSSDEIAKAVEDAQLHDYGKGMVRYRDINSKVKFRENPFIGNIKKTEVNTHTVKGGEALSKMGKEGAAKMASEHHSYPESFKDELLKAVDIYNARTGSRVYKDTETPEKALENILKYNVGKKPDQISMAAYNALKEAVEDGSIPQPGNFQSDLFDVYATEAGNAIEQKGIKLFDVDAAKNNAAYRYSDLVQRGAGSIMAGKALQDLSKYTFGKADTKAKKKLLLEYFKDKDKVMYDKLRNGYYTNNKSIDKIFEDNIDGIIEMQKN